ncbi:MAG TPA: hypothetical protein VGS12_02470 [Caulobacteraceae bacterium]|nr:hypothetical protein [Caulobacteraceae bacterium]
MSDPTAAPPPTDPPAAAPPAAVSPLQPHPLFSEHAHHLRVEERLSRVERRADVLMLIIIFGLGAAMAVGLLVASGHF